MYELIKNTGFLISHLRNHHIILAKKIKNIDEVIKNRKITHSKKEFLEIRKNKSHTNKCVFDKFLENYF